MAVTNTLIRDGKMRGLVKNLLIFVKPPFALDPAGQCPSVKARSIRRRRISKVFMTDHTTLPDWP